MNQFPAVLMGKHQQALADRKSTRLNSSHTVISYAVFCLKKKEHTSELQSHSDLGCRLLLEKTTAILQQPKQASHLNTSATVARLEIYLRNVESYCQSVR